MARALMLQGTGSDVGKSLLLAGLARAFTRRGLRVRPFKPQNMSNNAAVTADGGEIGRAQALQARACGTAPVTDMNPVLLKPQSESGAQIVLHGRVWRVAGAGEYRRLAPGLLPAVLSSFSRLGDAADLVLVEGAGSPAEVNLRAGDIANMGFAEAAGVPVVLIGDIERGGVIAQLVGTHALLPTAERALLAGYIVNKFRGDVGLFDGGITAVTAQTGMSCFGVVPYFSAAAALPAEDSLALTPTRTRPAPTLTLPRSRGREWGAAGEGRGPVRIAVPLLPRIANFDDLDPLRVEPAVELVMVRPGQAAAARCRASHSSRLEGDDQRSRILAARRVGHRPPRASPPRRTNPRPLWRISDAGQEHRRSARCGRAATDGDRASSSRHRDRSDRHQAPRRVFRCGACDRDAGSGLRNASRTRPLGRVSNARCCAWPAIRTAASAAMG